MRDLIGDIKAISEGWERIATDRLESERVKEVASHVAGKLGDMNPVLSLYGAYNAGKSTLLNALIGKEIASTGDSPETFRVEKYTWGEWTIYDTPGIDAPIEHEKITEEHLRKSECILFVVSTDGDLEARLIYERLAELVQRGKPVLLVLNDKIGMLREKGAEKESAAYERIDTNLDKIWLERGLDKYPKPEKIVVNAQSALKARLSEADGIPKATLLQKSYLLDLEKKLESFLRMRGTTDVVNSLVDYLSPYFDELVTTVAKELDDPSVQQVELARSMLDREKRKLLLEAERVVRGKLGLLCGEINQVSAENQSELELTVQACLSDLSETLEKMLEERLSAVAQEFSNEYVGAIIDLSGMDVVEKVRPSTNFSFLDQCDLQFSKIPRDQAKDAVKRFLLGKFTSETVEQGTKEIAKNSVRQGAKTTTKQLGKSAAKQTGKVAGRVVGKVIPVFVDVAFAVYDIAMAHKAQAEYESQVRAQAQVVENMISRVRSDVHAETMRQIDDVAGEFFAGLLSEVDAMENNLNVTLGNSSADLKVLRRLQCQLGELVNA